MREPGRYLDRRPGERTWPVVGAERGVLHCPGEAGPVSVPSTTKAGPTPRTSVERRVHKAAPLLGDPCVKEAPGNGTSG